MKNIGRNDPCTCGSGLKYKKCCFSHEGQYTVFVDEAGNSGSNYLDLDQPFYIVGGWIIPNARLNDTSLIANVAQTLKVEGELKGTNLTRNKRNQAHLSNFFNQLQEIGCRQTIVFAEKKYCIAAKVIETFLDPAYNHKVNTRYTYDNVLKKSLAEKVYRLPFEVLKKFAEAYRILEPEPMEKALKFICEALRDTKETDLADKLSGALITIESNTSSEKSSHIDFLPNNAAASLNVPAFISFITILEKYASSKNHRLSIIHDKTKAYEAGYIEVYRLYSEAERFEFTLTDGASIVMGFNHLKNIHFKDSKESPWIQSADVLISGLNRFLKAIYKDEAVNPELMELGKYISPAIMDDGYRTGDSVCSNETRRKIRSTIQESTASKK